MAAIVFVIIFVGLGKTTRRIYLRRQGANSDEYLGAPLEKINGPIVLPYPMIISVIILSIPD